MIPRKIHYCWFGGNPLSKEAQTCIESWKRYCTDYEIIEWNEQNFNVFDNKYTSQAYASKKWAFVTDYVRLKVLFEEGGIYMDTDVELLKPLDKFMDEIAFSGFEDVNSIPTGIMASEAQGEWVKYLLTYYDNAEFINVDGSFNLKTNVETITAMTLDKYNINLNNEKQTIENTFTLYPKDVFCPKNPITEELIITERTVAIHHFNGSWLGPLERASAKRRKKLTACFGKRIATIINSIIYNYQKDGISGVYKKVKDKLRREEI